MSSCIQPWYSDHLQISVVYHFKAHNLYKKIVFIYIYLSARLDLSLSTYLTTLCFISTKSYYLRPTDQLTELISKDYLFPISEAPACGEWKNLGHCIIMLYIPYTIHNSSYHSHRFQPYERVIAFWWSHCICSNTPESSCIPLLRAKPPKQKYWFSSCGNYFTHATKYFRRVKTIQSYDPQTH